MGGWWRWTLVSPDGVAPSRMVSVSASVNFPCTIKSKSSLLALAHPVVCVCVWVYNSSVSLQAKFYSCQVMSDAREY